MTDDSDKIRSEPQVPAPIAPKPSAPTASHTPGPWHFAPNNAGLMQDHGYGILYGEPDSWGWEKNLFVSVGCSFNVERALGKGTAEANARLIAAAPDLLEALKVARGHVQFFCDETDDEGTPECMSDLAQIDAALAKAEGR